ncbi:MAG TPA: DeoR family transcriptional regulator [Thalassobaculum sp.]
MDKATRRRGRIREIVAERGYASIDELVQLFAVTPQTIRRDINSLAERGELKRYHGGAGLSSSVENAPYDRRRLAFDAEKAAIGRRVAAEIPDDSSLFINIGTTTEAVARALLEHSGLRVITNNLNVAQILTGNPTFEVIIAGGVVRNRDGGIVGESATDLIQQFRVDIGVIGISGIAEDGSLLDFDYREVRVAQSIVRNSERVFLCADSSKFGRKAMVRLGHVSQMHTLFTCEPVPESFHEVIGSHNVRLVVADV